jgi:outer membrane autotransporter protein
LPFGRTFNAMALGGPVQGQILGATTFTNSGTIDLQANPVAGDVLLISGGHTPGVNGGGTFISNGGRLLIDTVLNEGGAASRSDVLVVDGTSVGPGGATGMSIRNAGGTGAVTVGNGILVAQVLDPSRSAAGAFTFAGSELRGGAFDYRLFQGGPVGGNTSDWFLRSVFGPTVPLVPLEPALPINPPPGFFPIIGPEIATYGVIQPIARQLGMTTLGTLHERTGDTSLNAIAGTPCPAVSDTPDGIARKAPAKAPTDCPNAGAGPSVWGRVLGQQIDNHYRAFADPRASGQVLGFQSGIDLWRSDEWMPGHRDAAGLYVGYASANVDVNGLVTNDAATGYVLRKTGGLNLDAWSGAAYWTHYGPGDWYLDAVAQATHYQGAANTQFASLATTGFGFVSSLETGYPIRLPGFGPGFVLEPEAQIVWQRVSFDDANDGLGAVALGTTSGASGRIGLRGRWTIVGDYGQVWQPYVRANLWRDWGAQATTTYSGADLVPLVEQATRLQLGGGLSVRVNANVSLYANADYQFALANTDGGRRDGVRGAAGVRYTW